MTDGLFSATLGDAHEHIVLGILIRLGLEVGKVDVSSTPYDLIIRPYKNPKTKSSSFIRAQIKTVKTSLSFSGGSRGGIDREYKSNVKTYTYSSKDTDIVIGIDRSTLDLYVVPIKIVEKCNQKSLAASKLKIFLNNWDIFLNWNPSYLEALTKKFNC